jgi:hypothetical protein
MIGAAAEVFTHHRHNHAEGPLITLGLALRKGVEMGNLGGSEKHGCCVRAGSDTCSTSDASRCVKSSIRSFFWDQDGIGIGSASRGRADEAACLKDSVKR